MGDGGLGGQALIELSAIRPIHERGMDSFMNAATVQRIRPANDELRGVE
ncbi:hypothetical protein MVI01_62630 [Myxococcus virescens]|uniref:Uncharacterized protein n=1 Tax=Myxococcus virescens TaxID=83456 RepID=A0A511HPR8_9BACT|nr:hypothetical protein MVI01_62630 [Myxococcus virescens]SDD72396.1 hypothetical protein SAMN04488504_102423 [Myxococcus virescens]